MSNIQLYKSPQGLGGWFGRKIKALAQRIVKAIEKIPIVGAIAEEFGLAEAVNTIGQGNAEFWNRTNTPLLVEMNPIYINQPAVLSDYEPTPAEAVILDKFADKFEPFYKTLAEELAAGLATATIAEKILIVNSVLNKMAVVKAYFAVNETAGLTPDGVKSRSELITVVFQPLHDVMNQKLSGQPLTVAQVSITINQTIANQFKGLITGSLQTTYMSQNYKTATAGTVTAPIVSNTPATPIKDTSGNSGIVPNPTSTTPTNTSGNGTTPDKKGISTLAVVGGIGTAIIIAFAMKKKKKPATAQSKTTKRTTKK